MDENAAVGFAYRAGELATAEWLRSGDGSSQSVRIPELLGDVPELVSAFAEARDRLLGMTLVLRAEQVYFPTVSGYVSAHFQVTRNADGEYQAHWGLVRDPPRFGDAYYSYAEADDALEKCQRSFIEATSVGELTLFGIPVPKYELQAMVWPAADLFEADQA